MTIIIFAINIFGNASNSIASSVAEKSPTFTIIFLFIVLNMVLIVIGALIFMNLIKISLDFLDEGSSNLSRLTESANFIVFLKTYLLYTLMVLGGLILLIIPGIIWAIKYQLAPYLVVDKEMGSIEAFKQSAKITDGVKGGLFLFGIVLSLVILTGYIALFVGVLIAMPVTWIASAFVYRDLLSQTDTLKQQAQT